ncbi:MAG: hypothetical protein QW092_03650 [Candidatus Korarchaeum sp.]
MVELEVIHEEVEEADFRDSESFPSGTRARLNLARVFMCGPPSCAYEGRSAEVDGGGHVGP